MDKKRRSYIGLWIVLGIAAAASLVFTVLFTLLDSVSGGVIIDWMFRLGETLPYLVVAQKGLVFALGLLLVTAPVLLVGVLVWLVSERRA